MQKVENTISQVGSEISLQCVLKGSEPMTVSWHKDDHEVREAEHMQISYKDRTALLHITNVQAQYGGKYTCQAQNLAGCQKCSAVLTVKGWLSL